jgi:hypothetical protein
LGAIMVPETATAQRDINRCYCPNGTHVRQCMKIARNCSDCRVRPECKGR